MFFLKGSAFNEDKRIKKKWKEKIKYYQGSNKESKGLLESSFSQT